MRIDKQGRLVLPRAVREELVDLPGELVLERTPDGVLLRPVQAGTQVRLAEDGLPVLDIDREVTNEEVMAAIDDERSSR